MNRILLLLGINLSIFSVQTGLAANDSTMIVTPEGIGKYLSGLLMNRGDIKKSSLAINIRRLLPDEDFSKFEDSPGMFILRMLYGQQKLLPQAWDNLLFQADSMHIDEQAKYLKTYFIQTHKDRFLSAVVLTSSSKYYTFTFSVLKWKNDNYVMRIYENLKEYNNNMEDLAENLFDIEEPQIDFDKSDLSDSYIEKDSLNVKEYIHNQSFELPEIEDVFVASASPFTNDLTLAIEQLQEYGSGNIFLTLENIPLTVDEQNEYFDYEENLKKMWKELILTLKEKKDFHIQNKSILLSNFPIDFYNIIITYHVELESIIYTFSCTAILVNNRWQLVDVSPLSEEPEIQFF